MRPPCFAFLLNPFKTLGGEVRSDRGRSDRGGRVSADDH